MLRRCAVCQLTFPLEQFPSRRAAGEALNYHLSTYHSAYNSWNWRIFSRLPFLFIAVPFVDALAFSGLGRFSPLIVPLPLSLLGVIIVLEFAGYVILLRSFYYRKLNSFRIDWQQHPTPIVEGRESTSSTDGSNLFEGPIDPGERYLGGFYSLQLGLGWGRNQTMGYGVYVTNRRLFGVSHSRPNFDRNMTGTPQNVSDDDNQRIISELSKMRQFQAKLDGISRIDLQIPQGLFRTGHLEIALANGDGLKIRVGRKQPGEQLKAVLSLFAPSVLTVS